MRCGVDVFGAMHFSLRRAGGMTPEFGLRMDFHKDKSDGKNWSGM
jgi:hypothetical protein